MRGCSVDIKVFCWGFAVKVNSCLRNTSKFVGLEGGKMRKSTNNTKPNEPL